MAYVNSGIEMKTSQYDWKMIALIILFLAAVAVLVTFRLLFPEITKEKLFAMLNSAPSTVESPRTEIPHPDSVETKPAVAVIPVNKRPAQHQEPAPVLETSATAASAAPILPADKTEPVQSSTAAQPVIPTTNQDVVATAAEADITPAVEQTTPSRSDTPKQMTCSAEDRAAELCQ
ncbi:MAG: hypothetical protein QMB71_02630 [Tolumonas sp.]